MEKTPTQATEGGTPVPTEIILKRGRKHLTKSLKCVKMCIDIQKGEWEMPRVNIIFTIETFEELKSYIITKHGTKKALSITVEEAVKDYLKRKELLEQLSR